MDTGFVGMGAGHVEECPPGSPHMPFSLILCGVRKSGCTALLSAWSLITRNVENETFGFTVNSNIRPLSSPLPPPPVLAEVSYETKKSC